MCPIRYRADDVDGVFAIVCVTTDSFTPSIVALYWPTVGRTRDVIQLLYTEDEIAAASQAELLSLIQCKQTYPGEYFNRYTLRTDRGIQRRVTGAVGSVDGNTSINRAVWQLAEEMARLKA